MVLVFHCEIRSICKVVAVICGLLLGACLKECGPIDGCPIEQGRVKQPNWIDTSRLCYALQKTPPH